MLLGPIRGNQNGKKCQEIKIMNLDIKIGDILLGGRFKNQRMEVKSFGTDELGQPTVNKRKLLSYRIEKELPEGKKSSVTQELNKEACDAVYQAALVDELEKIAKRNGKAKNAFEKLKDNQVPLTSEERNLVMKRKAVWHHGPNGEETAAVWKSVDPKTKKPTFIVHTHRAYNISPTVKGSINRYHKFIKGTA